MQPVVGAERLNERWLVWGEEEDGKQPSKHPHTVDNFRKRYDCNVLRFYCSLFSIRQKSFWASHSRSLYVMCAVAMYQVISTRFGHNSNISHSIFSPYIRTTYKYNAPLHLLSSSPTSRLWRQNVHRTHKWKSFRIQKHSKTFRLNPFI